MKTGKLAKVFTFLIFLFIFSFTAYAQQYDPERDFKVSKQEDGKSVVITEYIGSKKDVRIPPTIQGLPVTGISKSVFPPRSSLTSVTIPDGVTSIGAWAFNYCTNLTSVTIPSGVTDIGNQAFHECTGLTSVTFQCAIVEYPSIYGIVLTPSFPGGLWYKYLKEGIGTYIIRNPGENAVWTKQ